MKSTMTAEELRAIRAALGVTTHRLARKIGITLRVLQRQLAGEADIPEIEARVLRLAAKEPGLLDRLDAEASVVVPSDQTGDDL